MTKTLSWQSQSVDTLKDANGLDKEDKDQEYRASRDHIDPDKWEDNIILINQSLREAYDIEFGQALEDYNNKQIEKGHPERQIQDYLKHVSDGKEHKVMYSTIVQIGDRNTTGIGTETESGILKDYVKSFVERNPQMHVYSAVIHRDEPNGTDHLHLHYFPVASGFKRGMEVQTSLNRALYEQGFQSYKDRDGNKIPETAQQQWQQQERLEVERLCHERGIQIEYLHENREHLSKENYIMYSQNKELKIENHELEKDLQTKRDVYNTLDKDIQNLRDEHDGLKKLMKLRYDIPAPDGRGLHKGYHSDRQVMEIVKNLRAEMSRDREEYLKAFDKARDYDKAIVARDFMKEDLKHERERADMFERMLQSPDPAKEYKQFQVEHDLVPEHTHNHDKDITISGR